VLPIVRVLLVHPGADWSVADVHAGIRDAMQRQGVAVIDYAMNRRIENAGKVLLGAWKAGKKAVAKPNEADLMYHASTGTLERALRFKVDWVFIISAMYFHPDVLVLLRRAGIRTAALFTESPYDDLEQLRIAPVLDACWVNERASVAAFRAVQPRTWYYQHAIDLERHQPGAREGDEDVPAHDVVFVGTGFWERCELLASVDWGGERGGSPIDFGLYGAWDLLGSRSKLRKHLKGDITPNAKTAALYRRAKVGLNLHRTSRSFGRNQAQIKGAESMGPRCYELAAAGLPFVTDYRAEVADVFGDLVPTFTNGAELRAVLDRLLADAQERERIAAALPACVAGHTFDKRVAEMLTQLNAA